MSDELFNFEGQRPDAASGKIPAGERSALVQKNESKAANRFLAPLMRGADRFLIQIAALRSPVKTTHFFEHPASAKAFRYRSPEEVFPNPDRNLEYEVLASRSKAEVKVSKIAFATPRSSGFPENDRAVAYFTQNTDRKSRIATVFLHPWTSKSLVVELLMCRYFARQGVDSIMLVLPYHMERSPNGSFSGEYTLRGDPSMVPGRFVQAVSETRVLCSHLRKEYERVGIIGISLGGLVAHMGMTVEPFDFGISLLSGGPLSEVFDRGIFTKRFRSLLARSGVSFAELAEHWSVTDPVTWGHCNRVKKLLMINALYDQVVPPDLTLKLWKAFGSPEIAWYPSAHFTLLLFNRSVRKKMLEFITGK